MSITIRATPSSEYVFQSWSGLASGSSLSTTVTMDSDKAVVANFVKIQDPLVSVFLDLIMNYQVYCVINQEVC